MNTEYAWIFVLYICIISQLISFGLSNLTCFFCRGMWLSWDVELSHLEDFSFSETIEVSGLKGILPSFAVITVISSIALILATWSLSPRAILGNWGGFLSISWCHGSSLRFLKKEKMQQSRAAGRVWNLTFLATRPFEKIIPPRASYSIFAATSFHHLSSVKLVPCENPKTHLISIWINYIRRVKDGRFLLP